MSFLAPLYIIGLGAVGLPILLHLIRRVPKGRVTFSTLMFLTESPPRITRRSRIEHWLLLLLRAMAIILLALAFARPFFREATNLNLANIHGRRVALLIDRSASMRRADVWNSALQQAENVLGSLQPTDDIAVLAFDQGVETVADFNYAATADHRARITSLRQQLTKLQPSWRATDLGQALTTAAELLIEANDKKQSDADLQVVLISDLQEGANLAALQNYEWPGEVLVQILTVASKSSGNASLHLMGGDIDDTAFSKDSQRSDEAARGEARAEELPNELRVRVVNDADADRETFKLIWQDEVGKAVGAPVEVYVPPSQSRIVRVKRSEEKTATKLTLEGDKHDFDNSIYIAPTNRRTARVIYAGTDQADDPQGLVFFLKSALGDTPQYQTDFQICPTDTSLRETLPGTAMVFAPNDLSEPSADLLRLFVVDGGTVFVAVTEGANAISLQRLLSDDAFSIEEAVVGKYAMLVDVDFEHPLLSRFSDARYSDFTNLRFWKARLLKWSESSDVHVLANFDTGSPALIQKTVGKGSVYVLASSWKPADSQMALSTKFVPLMSNLLLTAGLAADPVIRLSIGQPFILPAASKPRSESVIVTPSAARHPLATDAKEFAETLEPGLYRWENGEGPVMIAVNLAPAESRTTAVDPSVLEQYQVPLGQHASERKQRERARQLLDQELEGRQQIWKWMVTTALGLLVLETWLGAWRGARGEGRGARAEANA